MISLTTFDDILLSQCAKCSKKFEGGRLGSTKLRVLKTEEEKPADFEELSNIQALSYVYGISPSKLAYNLSRSVKKSDLHGLPKTKGYTPSEEIDPSVSLALCDLCSPELAELYRSLKRFTYNLALDCFVSIATTEEVPNQIESTDFNSVDIKSENEDEFYDDEWNDEITRDPLPLWEQPEDFPLSGQSPIDDFKGKENNNLQNVTDSSDDDANGGKESNDHEAEPADGLQFDTLIVNISGPPFYCPVIGCGNKYSRGSHVNHHCLQKHNLKIIRASVDEIPSFCKICRTSFPKRGDFSSHWRKMHNNSYKKIRIECHRCKKRFKTLSDLKKHGLESHLPQLIIEKVEVHENAKVRCLRCTEVFTDADECIRHCKLFHKPKLKKKSVANALSFSTEEDQNKKSKPRIHPTFEQVIFCSYCDKTFHEIYDYGIHIDEEHRLEIENSSYQCLECSQRFSTEMFLETHRVCHSPDFPTTRCELCSKDFSIARNVIEHKSANHCEEMLLPVIKYKCPNCDKLFNREGCLRSHIIQVHWNVRAHQCSICGKSFKTKTYLNVHLKSHNDEKPFLCSLCGEKFRTTSTLRIHAIVHNEERPFACETCGRRFKKNTTLKSHRETHQAVGNLCCEICGEKFKVYKVFREHLKWHADMEKPGAFVCTICGLKLKHRRSLQKHMKWKHSDNSHKKVCNLCGKCFPGNYKLNIHIANRHPDEIQTVPNK